METDKGGARSNDRKPAPRHRDDDDTLAAEKLRRNEGAPEEHQDDLLDEGVEETFPASDPVSVKRIT
jgi:hypothetical protein